MPVMTGPRRASGTAPIQQQIAAAIRQRVSAGELKPGDPVPTLATLAHQWGCTVATAQLALAQLKREGVITGGRGKPAVVSTPPTRVRLTSEARQQQKDLVRRPAEERAQTGAAELATGTPIGQTEFIPTYDEIEADADLAEEFDLPEGAPIIRRTYRTVEAGTRRLLLWSVSYIPRALIESNGDLLTAANEPWPGGHQHQLYTVGIEIDRFANTLIAVQPSAEECDEWGMDPGVPMLRVRSRSIDTNGRVVEISDSHYPADRTEIAWTEQLERWQ